LLALAAYNTGEGNVARAVDRARAAGRPTDFFSLSLPAETRGYAPKLLAIRDLVADPETWSVRFQPVANEPFLGIVELDGQIDLALAAEVAAMPLDELYLLNPGFNRWATDPDGPHRLVLPVSQVAVFNERIVDVPADQRVGWLRHRVAPRETLGALARRYRTTVDELQRINELRGTMIRVGQDILVPSPARPAGAYTLSAPARLAATQAETRGGQRTDYIVRRGDSLWAIGQRHNVTVRELAAWNGMAPNDTLREGQQLVVWTEGRASGPNPANTTRSLSYTVRRGDSLARISRRFRVTVDDLVRWNRIDPDRYLQPGQRLQLYVDVTAQTGS
jgi:membrane-bound lytic murein transglycosylase D